MFVEEGHKGLQPSLSHLHVAVEQHIILCFNLFERLVVALSKTIVAVEHDETDLRKTATQQVERAVRRCVVCHHHLGVGRACEDRRQKLLEHVAAVPIENNDGGFTIHIVCSYAFVLVVFCMQQFLFHHVHCHIVIHHERIVLGVEACEPYLDDHVVKTSHRPIGQEAPHAHSRA